VQRAIERLRVVDVFHGRQQTVGQLFDLWQERGAARTNARVQHDTRTTSGRRCLQTNALISTHTHTQYIVMVPGRRGRANSRAAVRAGRRRPTRWATLTHLWPTVASLDTCVRVVGDTMMSE